MGLRSIVRRKYRATTNSKHSYPIADNLLQRNFTTDGPDKVWVSDITYSATARGWLYLTVFIDLYSRMVVGLGAEQFVEHGNGSYSPCTCHPQPTPRCRAYHPF